MNKNVTISDVVSFLRFPLTIGVVYIHFNINKDILPGIIDITSFSKCLHVFVLIVSTVLSAVCVPMFSFISGYFYFSGEEYNLKAYKYKLISRTKTLLIPFLIWNVIGALWFAKRFIPGLSNYFGGDADIIPNFTLMGFLNIFIDNWHQMSLFILPETDASNGVFPMVSPLWYVRELYVLVIFAPIFYYFLKKFPCVFLLTLAVGYFSWEQILPPDGGYIYQLNCIAFFFAIGSYFSINKINFLLSFRRAKYVPFIYMFLIAVDVISGINPFIHKIGIICGIVSVFVFVNMLLTRLNFRFSKSIYSGSFFVYCLHTLIMTAMAKLLFTFVHIPSNSWSALFVYFIIPVLTVSICYLFYMAINKSKVLKQLLAGNR